MRYLIVLLLGILSSFYLSALFKQVAGKKVHSIVGLFLLIIGFVLIFTTTLAQPLNLLFAFLCIGAGLGIIAHHLLAESYVFSEKIEKDFISRHENTFERFLEILPGALTWLTLTSPIWLSFTLPYAVAYLIIVADIYWLFNSVKIASLVFIGYRKVEKAKSQNWLKKLDEDFPNQWHNYYHLFVIPTLGEDIEVLGPDLNAIASSDYPKDKLFIAVGFEERGMQRNLDQIKEIKFSLQKISKKIGGVFTTVHPFGLPGEVPGPGTNRNFIIRDAVKEFERRGIPINQVIVTTLDADFVIHPQLPAGTIHKYLSTPESVRDKRTYTGAIMFYNNYWQAPAPMRLIATGTAFWQLAEMVGSDKYINYSSMSINLASLLDLGLWIPDKVNDDSGFYWKAYYHFNGDYKVIPHFIPINGDTVLDVTLPKTFQNQYLQLKRWAYGVEHIPFIIRQYFKNKRIDFWDKTDKLTFIIWSYFKWGTLALFISFGGLMIPLVNPEFSQSVVSYNLSVISSWILTAAFVGLISTVYVHEKTAPPRPANWSIFKKIRSYLQWFLIPIVLVTIASLPAIDAQTSLMLGRYLEYRVTRKARLKIE